MQQRQEQDADEAARSSTALWAVIITSVAGFMAALDNLVVTALPSIRKDLGGALEASTPSAALPQYVASSPI